MFIIKCDLGNYEVEVDYDKASETKKRWFTLVVELRKSWNKNGLYFVSQITNETSVTGFFNMVLPNGDKKQLSMFKRELKKENSIIARFINDQGIFVYESDAGINNDLLVRSQKPISDFYPSTYTGPHKPTRAGKRWNYELWCIEYTKRNWNNPRFFDFDVVGCHVKNDLDVAIEDVALLNAANDFALEMFKKRFPKEKLGNRQHLGHATSRWEAPFMSLYTSMN